MAPRTSYLIAPGTSAEQLAEQRQAAIQMLGEASSTKPVQHWAQILGQIAKGGLAGYEVGEAGAEGRRRQDEAGALFGEAFEALGGSSGVPGAAVAPGASAAVAPASPARGMAAAAGREGEMPPTSDMLSLTRQEEGFAPTAKWDIRQHSGGYGSKAAPGETFTHEKAEQYLQRDAAPVISWVNANAPNANELQKRALVSFGYNLGVDDLDKLKPDIQAGDWNRVGQRMLSFNKALNEKTGQLEPLAGLTSRRQRESGMITGAGGASPVSIGAPQRQASIAAGGPDDMALAGRLYRNEATRPLAGKMLEARIARANKKPEIVTIELGNGQKVSAMQMPDGTLQRVDMSGLGGADGAKLPPNFDDTQKLRKEYQSQTNVKKFDDAIGPYQSMLTSAQNDTATADIDMVYGLATILDPESVVREGEFATIRAAQSIPDRFKGEIQYLFEGKGRLSPEAREKLMEIAANRLDSYRTQAMRDSERFGELANEYGMDPALIRRNFQEIPRFARRSDVPAAPGVDPARGSAAAAGRPPAKPPVVEHWERGPDGRPRRVN